MKANRQLDGIFAEGQAKLAALRKQFEAEAEGRAHDDDEGFEEEDGDEN
jgi:hypothetical protein